MPQPAFSLGIVVWPLAIVSIIGLFFFVLKTPKDLGIYLGWLPSLIFLMLTIFVSIYALIALVIVLAVYILGAALRIDQNKKIKEREEKRLKEIDKMSINDL